VHLWQPGYDKKTRLRHHTTAPGFGHALLAPVVAHYFSILRVSATLWDAGEWFVICSSPSPSSFEYEHGVETERGPYNARHFAEVHRQKKMIVGQHAGLSDLFVPVLADGKIVAVLVVGPFAVARPTSADILARWRWMTGRQGHPRDPEFAAYLSATLATLVLDAGKLATFERFALCFSLLLSGQGQAGALTSEAHALGAELEQIRIVERTWEAARSMVDHRSSRGWQSVYHAYELHDLGLSRPADSVLVGLAARVGPDIDPVDEAVRRDAFQRSAVELARRLGDVVAGQVGDHGVVLLFVARGNRRLRDLADRASSLARRRFGLSLHFGASVSAESAPLSRTYQAALAAAESALTQGTAIVTAEPGDDRPHHALRRLREELGPAAEQRPAELAARFDRYLEAVALACGYRTDVARGHLDAGFERMAGALVDHGALDGKSYAAMCDGLDRAASEARTMDELFAAYRRTALDVSEAVQSPASARHERSVRGAVDYIRQHYAEPLRLATVARVAGLTPNYFSQLFRQRERATFTEYVSLLRIERAKQLLTGTNLDMTRLAELSGFHSPQYFARMFRRTVGRAPLEYRRRQMNRTR
jgi:AraC-like DNA-binding protein